MNRLLFSLLSILCFPGILLGLEVRFKEEAVVYGPVLTLEELATITPVSKAEVLSDLVLFPSPPAGERRCYESDILKAYVLDSVVNKKSIRWEGAETVCVRHEGKSIGSGGIQSVIDKELRKALEYLAAERVFFEARNLPELSSLPPGQIQYEVLFSDPGVLKSRQVNVIVKVDGKVAENLTIAGRVRAYLPVVVANGGLARGTVLSENQVKTEIENIADLQSPFFDPKDIVGKRLKRSVVANHVFGQDDLEMPVLIERRQVVTMLLQKGGLEVSAKGVATTDGKLGDSIIVKNIDSRKTVACRVIGPGLAKVEF